MSYLQSVSDRPLRRRLVIISAMANLAIMAAAVLSLMGWVTGMHRLGSWVDYGVPMAANTAILFIGFAVLLIPGSSALQWKSLRILMLIFASAAELTSISVLWTSGPVEAAIALLFHSHTLKYPEHLSGNMSPFTA
ncbi:MAG: hypothetical protein HQL37_12760, partial [Alphaproteobacteria bacterium]|nr:hypothetical protein [Alphaproteobacteria bacterium]